jgi:hypothetical protein
MKSILFTVITILLVLTSHAQNPSNGVYFGLPNRNVSIRNLVEYNDKGYYLQNLASTPSGTGSMSWNIKTDINKEVLWDHFLTHNSGIARGDAVVLDNEGNRYVGGIIFFNFPDHPFVAKFNPCGDKEWCVMLPKEGYGQGVVKDIIINDNEELIVLLKYLAPSSPEIKDRLFIAALSKDGALLWRNVYASPDNYPLLHNPTGENLIYINGEYYIAGRCYYAYPSNPSHVYHRAFFVGIDSIFSEKWILPFGSLDSIIGDAWNILPINDTLLMSVGSRWLPSPHWYNSLLMFFDKNGNEFGHIEIQSSSISPEIDYNAIRTISQVNDTLFLSPLLLGMGGENMFGEIVFDLLGNIHNYAVRDSREWVPKMAVGYDSDNVIGVQVQHNTAFKQVFLYKVDENLQSVPLDTTTYVYDSLCPYPIQSGTIDLTGCMVLTSTDWIPTPQEYYARIRTIPITIYPNPAKDHITFALENTEHHRNIELRCFNLLGMQQYQTTILRGQQQTTANVSTWPPGMYVVVVYSEGRPVGRGKFVVQK